MAEDDLSAVTGGGMETEAETETETERKRQRDEEDVGGDVVVEEEGVEAKKQRSGDEPTAGTVKVGYKEFGSSVNMFDYFCKLLHAWPTNVTFNKYEHGMLLDLIKKGHAEPDKKIGNGIKAFLVRYHPLWKSKCFFFVREDKSSDDFSFRKCVNHILPLPEDMRGKAEVNKALGGRNRGGGRGCGRGRGRGRGRH